MAALWESIRAFDTADSFPTAARAVQDGARPQDVATAMTAAAYEAVFQALYLLTGAEHLEWVEDRAAAALHEDLLSADPTGREGSDLFT